MGWLVGCLRSISGPFLFVRSNECFRNISVVVFASSAFKPFAIQYFLDWIPPAVDILLYGKLYWLAKVVVAR